MADLASRDVSPSMSPVPECNVIATCTVRNGQVGMSFEDEIISHRGTDPSCEGISGCSNACVDKNKDASVQPGSEEALHGILKPYFDQFGRIKFGRVCSEMMQQPLWHPKAATAGAFVGAEREDHDYMSLMDCVNDVSQPLSSVSGIVKRVSSDVCRKTINAMLNHSTGGYIHFGIRNDGIVEEGLDLEQSHVIGVLKKEVDKVLQTFFYPVQSKFAEVDLVILMNDKCEPTGRWRFDIIVEPHETVVLLSHDETACYRQGPKNLEMVYGKLVQSVRAEFATTSGSSVNGGAERNPSIRRHTTTEHDNTVMKDPDVCGSPNAMIVAADIRAEREGKQRVRDEPRIS